ncbi:MAG: right-handed parallel beta-helix repeat-containing protein, partial [Planctomycetota bacterium]
GTGNGYGGAIACLGNSDPRIWNCTISNNSAHGGRGGNGGAGGNAAEFPDFDQGLQGPGGNAGDSIGDGIGGAIYCGDRSNPIIEDCIFINNIATTGIPGTGGPVGLGNASDPPAPPTGANSHVESTGGIAGGALYFADRTALTILDSVFTNNQALDQSFGSIQYTRGGALFCERHPTSGSTNRVNLTNCQFTSNLAGAVYYLGRCRVNLTGCTFTNNSEAAFGGAVYVGLSSSVEIHNSVFGGNSAYLDGGALKLLSDATLSNCSFSNNVADSDGDDVGGYGGAIDLYRGSTSTINASVCSFSGNQAIYGGGFSSENFNATFEDCYFIGNTALEGGGMHLVNGDVAFSKGIVSKNTATDGDGGGLYCGSVETDISDSTISENSASYSGAGIMLYGGASEQNIFNCLLTLNSANDDGGAIYCQNAAPEIGNCTFSDNITGGLGGAIFSNFTSNPNIIDSIFQNNHKHAIHEEDSGGDATVTYSLFFNNPDGDYYDSDEGLFTGPGEIDDIPGGSNNIWDDPDFVTGPVGNFYLKQSSSPAVDSGSALAADLGLDINYTTATTDIPDTGQVDRGYHYFISTTLDQYELSTSVINGHGSIDVSPPSPDELPDGYYYTGTLVTLTAVPDPGWWVKAWSGTDDDTSTSTTNSVIMNIDRSVTVEFRQPNTLHFPSEYSHLQEAIDAAEDGDIIIVAEAGSDQPYASEDGFTIDKDITITCEQPDDPVCVANTVFEKTLGPEGGVSSVFRFSGVGRNA